MFLFDFVCVDPGASQSILKHPGASQSMVEHGGASWSNGTVWRSRILEMRDGMWVRMCADECGWREEEMRVSSACAFLDDGVVPRGADEFAVRIAVHDVDAIQLGRRAAQFRRFRLPDGMQITLQWIQSFFNLFLNLHFNLYCNILRDSQRFFKIL